MVAYENPLSPTGACKRIKYMHVRGGSGIFLGGGAPLRNGVTDCSLSITEFD